MSSTICLMGRALKLFRNPCSVVHAAHSRLDYVRAIVALIERIESLFALGVEHVTVFDCSIAG